MHTLEVDGITYATQVSEIDDVLDRIEWRNCSDGSTLQLIVGKLARDDVTSDEIRAYLVWKLRFPWRTEAVKDALKRDLEVDGEFVEFSLDSPSLAMGVPLNTDVSKIPSPEVILLGRSIRRKAALQNPADIAHLADYTDQELRSRWRSHWQSLSE